MRSKASEGMRTFTDLARRAQIARCAADALAEVGYSGASMAEIARRAGIAKSVVSYHFAGKDELMKEVVRVALAAYAEFMNPRLEAAKSPSDRLSAYLRGTAAYIVKQHSLHAAVIEIAFNATSADGLPLVATMPLQAPEPSVEEILLDGQQAGEFRDFDVTVVAEMVRSAANHAMVLRHRSDPTTDLDAYADEVIRLFDIGLKP